MKLIFLDADGTLLHSDGHIPESTILACELAQKNGHKICLGTGRQVVEIIGDLKKINFDACICGSGSTVIVDDKTASSLDCTIANIVNAKHIIKSTTINIIFITCI